MAVEVIADVGSCWRDGPDEPLAAGWDRWLRLMDAVAAAGAQAVKGQYLRRTVYPKGSKEAALVAGYEWPLEWVPKLRAAASARGLEWLCTAYEPEHVPLLDPWVQRHKVSSFEAGHEALLRAVVATGKPVLLSLGMGQRPRVLGTATERVTWLHCVSAYPADPSHGLNLARIAVLARWPHRAGFSDHTPPTHTLAAQLAVALGATVLETHVCASHADRNPDAGFARAPDEFRRYVAAVREAEALLGEGQDVPLPQELTAYRYDPFTGTRGVPA